MPKSLTASEVIIYLHAAKKGVWEDIYKAISDKEELPDVDDCRKVIAEFKKDNEGAITIVDSESYPAILKRRKHPPFVIVPYGDLNILSKDQIVCLEDSTLSPSLTKHNIRHAFIDDDGVLTIRIPRLDTATGEFVNDCLNIKESHAGSLNTMALIGKKFVAITGSEDFAKASEETGTRELYALPGNSGCACNQLIKSGWHLCDTWIDLVFEDDPSDPKE